MKSSILAFLLFVLMAFVAAASGEAVPAGDNCHKSCYTGGKLSQKLSYFKACKAKPTVLSSGKKDGCKLFVYYKFKTHAQLQSYQNCEKTLKSYASGLGKVKGTLPKNVAKNLKC